jgi:ABC-2 type transport system permease protein
MSTEVYEVKGPAAISGDWHRLGYLARILAVTDFKLRFFDSALGYLWTLIRPLLLFGVLYVVFSQVVRVGDEVEHYPVVLLSALVFFYYLGEATTKAVTSVLDHESLVRKVQFPRMVIPVSVVLSASFFLGLNLIVVFGFIVFGGVEPRWTWLELPLLIAILIFFVAGLAMLLSALYVPFRDVRPIWEVLLQIVFYGTPILYPIELLSERSNTLAQIALCNPLAALIQQFRHAIVDPDAPSAAAAIGGAPRLLVPAAIVIGLFALGLWVFNRLAPRIAEEL